MADVDSKALELISRFAYCPNNLGFCGLESAGKKFVDCVSEGRCEGVAEELPEFKVLHPYLQMIAEVTGKHWLDYEVAEAYWLGNDLLEEFGDEHYDVLMDWFLKQGLPDFFVEEVRNERPKTFIPVHLFNILHVGVGRVTASVERNLENINQCMVRWGEVTKVEDEQVTVELHSLVTESEIGVSSVTVDYMPEFLPEVGLGDIVALHWKAAVMRLDEGQVENLEKWTRRLVEGL